MEDLGNFLFGLFILGILIGIYFAPFLIALERNHHQIGVIGVINTFLGWTLLGWVISLAWAFSYTPNKPKEYQQLSTKSVDKSLDKCETKSLTGVEHA